MRTVHETEALRPSDPVPKSMQAGGGPAGKSAKVKIIIRRPDSHAADRDDSVDDASGGDDGAEFTPLTEEQGFTPRELDMSIERLMKLCRLQAKIAEAEGEKLRKDCKRWEELYKQEWLEKEILLDQVVRSEQAWHARRQAVLKGMADVQLPEKAVANGIAGVDDDGPEAARLTVEE